MNICKKQQVRHILIKCIILVFFCCQIFSSGIGSQVYAQEETSCIACATTPTLMQQYITFTQEVLATINTTNPATPNLGRYESPGGLFTQGPFEAVDKQNGGKNIFQALYQGLKKNMQQKRQATFTTITIISHITTSNIGMTRIIIFRSKAIIRDRKKLQELDTRISDILFDTALAGAIKDPLSAAHKKKLLEIAQKYQGEDKIFATDSVSIGDNAKYGQLLKFLWKLNRKHKSFLATKSASIFGNGEDMKEISKGDFSLIFQDDYGKILTDEYACTRVIGACSDNFTKFGQAMKEVGNNFSSAAKDSANEIKQSVITLQKALQGITNRDRKISTQCTRARNPLLGVEERKKVDTESESIIYIRYNKAKNGTKAAREKQEGAGQPTQITETQAYKECNFSTWAMGLDPETKKENQAFIQRERELLATQYGIYVKDATIDKSIRGQGDKLLDTIRTNVIETKQKAAEESYLTDTESSITKQQQDAKKAKKTAIAIIQQQQYTLDADKLKSLQSYEDILNTTLDTTISSHTQALQEATLTDTRPITKAIAAMVQKIRYTESMVADRNNKDSLIRNLGEACELQCGNLGGKCRSK